MTCVLLFLRVCVKLKSASHGSKRANACKAMLIFCCLLHMVSETVSSLWRSVCEFGML